MLSILCHIHYQCKFSLKHGNGHWQHPIICQNIARISETRWKLPEDLKFKRERKIKLISKKAWGKRKCTQKKKLLDILYENDWHILTLFLKILSHQKIYKFCSGIMFSMMTKHHQSLLKITLRCLWLYDLHILFVSQFNESTNWEGTTYS